MLLFPKWGKAALQPIVACYGLNQTTLVVRNASKINVKASIVQEAIEAAPAFVD